MFNRTPCSRSTRSLCGQNSKETARHEATELLDAELLRKKGERAAARYQVNPRFEHLTALDTFIRETTSVSTAKDHWGAQGKRGHFDLSHSRGISTGILEPQIDLLVVGDTLDERALSHAVHSLDTEFGREIRYASFITADFRYRLGVYDRLYGTFSIIHTVSSSTKSGCKNATLCAGARILAT